MSIFVKFIYKCDIVYIYNIILYPMLYVYIHSYNLRVYKRSIMYAYIAIVCIVPNDFQVMDINIYIGKRSCYIIIIIIIIICNFTTV